MFISNFTQKKPFCFSRKSFPYLRRYKFHINEDGSKELKLLDIKEWKDIYAEIQLYKNDANINSVVSRLTNDQLELLDKNKYNFATFDLSNIPDNINDIRQLLINGYDVFSTLPLEFRDLFGNDFGRFAKIVDDGELEKYAKEYNDIMLNKKNSAEDKVEDDKVIKTPYDAEQVKGDVNNEKKV